MCDIPTELTKLNNLNLKNIAEGLQYYFTENIDYKNDISYKPDSALSVKILEKVL